MLLGSNKRIRRQEDENKYIQVETELNPCSPPPYKWPCPCATLVWPSTPCAAGDADRWTLLLMQSPAVDRLCQCEHGFHEDGIHEHRFQVGCSGTEERAL